MTALEEFDAEVRRAGLRLLAEASGGENADLDRGVAMILERPDLRDVLGFLGRFAFEALSSCGSSDGARSFILDEVDVADFRMTMPDEVDLEEIQHSIPFPEFGRPA
ncbi:hypothetical protein [Mycolicibacterium sp. J2]|uniref:hypothetical protein n=1 Tax=Mycolicibacterium sp. J2 TaxID=2993511 RepID=UPI00224B8F52|nr:hypothetical protein [Mycolicibacterium sp. J2]MCX2712046.1 hypothetical protein [Mycolicibacterium sp. J2]